MMQRSFTSEKWNINARRHSRCRREKSHETRKNSQVSRRDSISLNRWLVYRLQLLNHRVSSSSSCRHRDHNLFRFFRLARRLSIFLFSITSVRARHPQDLRRRRSSLPTGNSLEYRPTPLLLFLRSNNVPEPFDQTRCAYDNVFIYNRFDSTKFGFDRFRSRVYSILCIFSSLDVPFWSFVRDRLTRLGEYFLGKSSGVWRRNRAVCRCRGWRGSSLA